MFTRCARSARAQIRRIARGAMLVLVFVSMSFVGSCERRPVAGQALVGTWHVDPMADSEFAEALKRMGVEKTTDIPPHDPNDPEAELPMRFTFERDGAYTMTGSVLGHSVRETAQWRLKKESANTITIDLINAKKPPATSMTFVFLEPDLIRWETICGPTFLRRVKQ